MQSQQSKATHSFVLTILLWLEALTRELRRQTTELLLDKVVTGFGPNQEIVQGYRTNIVEHTKELLKNGTEHPNIVLVWGGGAEKPVDFFGTGHFGNSHFGADISSREHSGTCTVRRCRRFGRWTFRHRNVSARGLFGTGTFRHGDVSAPKHFGTELFRHLGRPATFRHVHVLTRGLFVAGTFRHLYFSAPVLFGTGTFRHWDFLARRLFGTGTFRHWEYLGREFSALGMARFFWCRFLAPFTQINCQNTLYAWKFSATSFQNPIQNNSLTSFPELSPHNLEVIHLGKF